MIGGISLADVRERVGIAESIQSLFQFSEIFRTQEHRCGTAVAGNSDPVVFAFDTVDNLAEPISDLAQRLDAHGHNCGPLAPQ